MAFENILIEKTAPVLCITLNRPKANALSLPLIQELRQAVDAGDQDPEVRVILITGGEGKFFAAGADIPTIRESLDDPMAEGTLLAEGVITMNRIEACNKPVVAVVNGMALGGGCELCLACHIRIASKNAVFGQPEINLGIIPGWGGMYRLPQLIGDSRAREWLMSARIISAEEALQAGLLAQVTEPEALMEAAKKLAATLAAKPAVAMRATLDILRERTRHPDQGPALERAGFAKAAGSRDAAEGIAAFVEKREAKFTGE